MLSPFSGLCENSTRGVVVFYLGWAQDFSRKNRVFIIFNLFIISIPLNFCFLLCQEQPVRTGSKAVCENFTQIVKMQFTPLLCFVLSNLTSGIRAGSPLKINILRDPEDEYTTWHT